MRKEKAEKFLTNPVTRKFRLAFCKQFYRSFVRLIAAAVLTAVPISRCCERHAWDLLVRVVETGTPDCVGCPGTKPMPLSALGSCQRISEVATIGSPAR